MKTIQILLSLFLSLSTAAEARDCGDHVHYYNNLQGELSGIPGAISNENTAIQQETTDQNQRLTAEIANAIEKVEYFQKAIAISDQARLVLDNAVLSLSELSSNSATIGQLSKELRRFNRSNMSLADQFKSALEALKNQRRLTRSQEEKLDSLILMLSLQESSSGEFSKGLDKAIEGIKRDPSGPRQSVSELIEKITTLKQQYLAQRQKAEQLLTQEQARKFKLEQEVQNSQVRVQGHHNEIARLNARIAEIGRVQEGLRRDIDDCNRMFESLRKGPK